MNYRDYMALAERQYWNTLSAAGMPISKMAEHAGLNRTALYKHFQRVGLSINDLPRNARYGNRGNEAWQGLSDQ